jgi:hypothetical protein
VKNIIVYKVSDGDILRCVTCPDGMESIQCHEGEDYIEHGRVDDRAYKIDLATLEVVPVA